MWSGRMLRSHVHVLIFIVNKLPVRYKKPIRKTYGRLKSWNPLSASSLSGSWPFFRSFSSTV